MLQMTNQIQKLPHSLQLRAFDFILDFFHSLLATVRSIYPTGLKQLTSKAYSNEV